MSTPYLKPTRTLVPEFRQFTGLPAAADGTFAGLRSGSTVDSWASKIKDGTFAGSAYSMNALEVKVASPMNARHIATFVQTLNADTRYPALTALWDGSFKGYYMSAVAFGLNHRVTSSAENEAAALSRLYTKIKSEYQSFDSVTFLAEFRETLQMLRRPGNALIRSVSDFLSTLTSARKKAVRTVKRRASDTDRSLRLRRLKSVKDGVAGSYLELVFGWNPLVSDVKEIAETAAKALVGRQGHSRVSASSPVLHASEVIASGKTRINENTDVSFRRVDMTRCSTHYVAGIRSHATGPVSSLNELARLSGFDLRNVPLALYEVLPYSFIVDYFLNIGDILEAACTDTSDVFYFSKTVRQQTDFLIREDLSPMTDQAVVPGAYLTNVFSGTRSSRRLLTRTTLTRSVGASLPIPPLVVSIPGIDSDKWFKMAAVVAQSGAFRFR